MNNKIGALWLKTSVKGNKFMSGEIELNNEKFRVVVFKNDKDGVETRPDYQIFLSEDQEQKTERKTAEEEIDIADISF